MQYRLVRTDRRTLAITIDGEGECMVRAPLRMPQREIEAFVAEKTAWILAKQREMQMKSSKAMHLQPILKDGAEWNIAGRRLVLCFVSGVPKNYACFTEATLECSCNITEKALIKFLKQFAKDYFAWRVSELAAAAHANPRDVPRDVKVSEAQARWGSCSAQNVLNFSWRLIFAPPALIDYVVVHELCHIGCMNHSHAFWQRVAALMPDYAIRRKQLKECGYILKWFRQ